MVIRARCIIPICGAPFENGAIQVEEGRIRWIGRWQNCPLEPGEMRIDLGEVAVLPGLINAHCHLDYTRMAGQIPPPKFFPDWIKTILSFKAHWSFSEFAESWLAGARMLLESGTTTVADTESVPELLQEVWKSTPLRVISYLEMTGVKSQRRADEILNETLDTIGKLPVNHLKQTGLSPHALYSTTPELMRKCAEIVREKNLLLSTHLAESETEYLMFTEAQGPFFDWLKGQRSMLDCGRRSPIQLASEYGLLTERCMAVHANYLAPGDVELIAAGGASVAHCPRSHEYFGHDPFPFELYREAGVNVCLGTDSLATCRKVGGKLPELDVREEMRIFARNHPGVSPLEMFRMSTENAARALGKADEIGALKVGAFADIAAITYTGPIVESRLYEELLYSGNVREVFVAGELARTP